ncbi:MAG: hypothetical protein IKR13_04020 [Victivallales bacterium]|nr:hypothetical protein [Victivallales bacterium]
MQALIPQAAALLRRLHQPDHYSLTKVFQPADYDWPGDFEGRYLLAISRLSELSGEPDEALAPFLDGLNDHWNQQGFFGAIPADGHWDEQQLSGHGWLMRGLAAAWRVTRRPELPEQARRILHNLAARVEAGLEYYPWTAQARRPTETGGVSGHVVVKQDGWSLSSDIGCIFIFADGLSEADHLFNHDVLLSLRQKLLAAYRAFDPLGNKAQTHAFLTGARFALREGDIATAELAAQTYRAHGMTDTFANDNWFGRPEWTEPCAVADSLILHLALHRATANPDYMDYARLIWFNAFLPAQRDNGGFGCDSCLHGSADTPRLEVRMPEAFFCCTMRAAEAFAEAAKAPAKFWDGEAPVKVPLPRGVHVRGAQILAKDAAGGLHPLATRRSDPWTIYW